MRLKIYLLLTVLLCVSTINAQNRKFYGEFVFAATATQMDFQGSNMYKKHKIGFGLGGYFNYKFFGNLQLQTGFLMLKKGSLRHQKGTFMDETGLEHTIDIKNTIDANYMQLPLNMGIDLKIVGDLRFHVNGGVYIAYGFKGEIKQRGFTQSSLGKVDKGLPTERTFRSGNYDRWDYGLGVNFGLSYDVFLLKFQYDHGMNNIISKTSSEPRTRNRSYFIGAGFRF